MGVPSRGETRDNRRLHNYGVLFHRPRPIRVRVRLTVVVFPPERLQVCHGLFGAAIWWRLLFRLFYPVEGFIVVVSVRFRARASHALARVIARTLVLRAVCAPTAASRDRYLASCVDFRDVQRSTPLVFFYGVGLSVDLAHVVSVHLGLPSFLRVTRVDFRPLGRRVRLLRYATVERHDVGKGRRFAFVTVRVASLMCFLYGGARTTAWDLISCQLCLVLRNEVVGCLVVVFRPFAFSFRLLKRRGCERARPRRRW